MNTRQEGDVPAHIRSAVAKTGGRVSGARKRIIAFLNESAVPLSIQKIIQSVKVDEVSVYRTIAFFKSLGLIEELVLPSGERQYALIHDHHHHIICTECSYVAHVPCVEHKTTRDSSHAQFSRITSHNITYYGVCKNCHG